MLIIHQRLGSFPTKPLSQPIYSEFYNNFGPLNELDGCFHVYLDVGSNVGVQVRKLFESELYPDAPVLKVFDHYFGSPSEKGTRDNRAVCAVGFEPNPHHSKHLKSLESSHSSCGFRTIFYTETAASHEYGTTDFFTDSDMKNNEWGGNIIAEKKKQTKKFGGTTKIVRFSDYILHRVVTRRIPETHQGLDSEHAYPAIIMKLDIEGSELEVLSDLVITGAFRHLNYTFVEYHSDSRVVKDHLRSENIIKLKEFITWFMYVARQYNLGIKTIIDGLDDETFHNSNFTMKHCN